MARLGLALAGMVCAGTALAAEPGAPDPLPDVRDVAGETLTVLYDGGDAVLLDFRFPPGISLPDHAAGPRAVIIMSDGTIERTGGAELGQRTELTAGTALWLDGTRGSGFVNASDGELRYLVFQPSHTTALGQRCQPEILFRGEGEVEQLLRAPLAAVWRMDVRGEAWIQLGDGSRRSVVVLADGSVPVLAEGEVLRIEDTSALLFCNR
jgi:quercetin dioxygenase-like cupin family protein